MLRRMRALAPVVLLAVTLSCDDGTGSIDTLHLRTQVVFQGVAINQPSVSVAGQWEFDLQNPHGSVTILNAITDGSGRYDLPDGRVNALWQMGEGSGPCQGQSVSNFEVFETVINNLVCAIIQIISTVSPSTVDVHSTPAGISISGDSVSSQYGMPHIVFYDEGGAAVSDFRATWVSSDGTSLQATTPSLQSLYSGTYVVMVMNIQADETLSPAFGTTIALTGNDPPSGGGGGGGGDNGCPPNCTQ